MYDTVVFTLCYLPLLHLTVCSGFCYHFIGLVVNLRAVLDLGWPVNTIKSQAESNLQHCGHQGQYQLSQAQQTPRREG